MLMTLWRSHGVDKASCGHLVTSWLVTVLFQKRILATPGRAINAGSIRERLLRSVQRFFVLSSCHPKGFHLSWVQSIQHSHFEFHFRKSPFYLVANNTSSNEKKSHFHQLGSAPCKKSSHSARNTAASIVLEGWIHREVGESKAWGKKNITLTPQQKHGQHRVIYAAASSVWCNMPTSWIMDAMASSSPLLFVSPPKTWNPKTEKKHPELKTEVRNPSKSEPWQLLKILGVVPPSK